MSKTSGPLDAGGQSLSAVPVPDLAASCPSVLEDVLMENLSGKVLGKIYQSKTTRLSCCRGSIIRKCIAIYIHRASVRVCL